jgi:hypothetical protein
MKYLLHPFLFLFFVTVFMSCKEEVAPTVLEIQVLNEDGDAVPNADIVLACTSSVDLPCNVEIIGQTDENGFYSKEFDLPKVLEISVSAIVLDSQLLGLTGMWQIKKDSVCGGSFVSIKPEETTHASVIAYNCN